MINIHQSPIVFGFSKGILISHGRVNLNDDDDDCTPHSTVKQAILTNNIIIV